MKTNSIRKLACSLALIKVLSSTSFLVDNNRYYYMLDDNGYIHVVDDINIIKDKCRTFKNENKDAYIFDKDNTKSYQYGGNQKAFKYNFNSLISNPLIWDEMQLYFPISDFDSYEKAMEFYRSYFNTISNCGCAYAGVTNKIFETFYGKEEEFEKIFGFPMYVINEDNSIDFNYELLILKFFNYSILYPNYSEGKKELIRDCFDKHFFYDFGIFMNDSFGNVKEFLEQYNISVEMDVQMCSDGIYHTGDIIGSDNFDLYKEDNGEIYSMIDDFKSHCLYVTEVIDGKVIVSTWGERYIFDDKEANWTSKLELKLHNNN